MSLVGDNEVLAVGGLWQMYGTLAPVGIQSVNHEVKGKEQMFLAWGNHMFWVSYCMTPSTYGAGVLEANFGWSGHGCGGYLCALVQWR